MKIAELYTNLLEEALEEDTKRISNHAPWLADLVLRLPRDPAYKKLSGSLREEIENIIAAVE